MAPILVHQKQYVLGPRAVSVRPDWVASQIADGLVLSHCPNLRVIRLRSRDDVEYCLLGLAVPADVPKSSVSDTFHLRESGEIEEWTGCWAGRWLLVSPNLCCQDASGCLGVYYRRAGGDLWMSSSPALLGDHLPDMPASARLPWRVVHNKGIDWIPAPFTTRDGVLKIPPQRTLNPRDGTMRPVRYVRLTSNGHTDVELLALTLKTIMTNWARVHFREQFIALTAGLDTRTVLAAAVGSKISVQTFTTDYPVKFKRDVILPPRIAARVGVPYTLRRPLAISPDEMDARMAAMSEHMDGATFHTEVAYYSRYDDDLMHDRGRTFAKGHFFEMGRCRYWAKFSNVGQVEPPTDPDQILAAFMFRSSWRPEPVQLWRQAFKSWIASLSDPVPLAMDWRDRFYLDQRAGAWNAIVQQGFDVFGSTFFYPGNCLRIFDLLLRHDPERRKEGFAQREAIRLLAPSLLKVPINPEPISKRLKETVRDLLDPRVIHALKSLATRSGLRQERRLLTLPDRLYRSHGVDASADLRKRLASERINVIFDVGANLGQSAQEFERTYPRSVIYSFEPDPDIFLDLQRSIGPRTRAIPVGLSSRIGKFRFDNSDSNQAMHRIASDQHDSDLPEVEFTTLDSFCSGHNITRIDLLKIDTEGHDLDVIKGAEQMLRASSVSIVIAECSMNRDNTFHVQFCDIHRHMEQLGYRLFGIYEQVHEWPTNKPNLRRSNVAYISPVVIARNVVSCGTTRKGERKDLHSERRFVSWLRVCSKFPSILSRSRSD